MQSLRGNLANIPNALSNLISTVTSPIDGTDFATVPSSPTFENDTLASVSGDDSSDKSHAIPNSLIKEEWQLVLDQDASIDDLTNAIEKCKELVLKTDECSTERKWLVRHLVELRFRLREMEDANIDHSKSGASYRVSVHDNLLVVQTSLKSFKIKLNEWKYIAISNWCICNRLSLDIILLTIITTVRSQFKLLHDRIVIIVQESFGALFKHRTFVSIVIFASIINVWKVFYGFVLMS